MMSTLPWLVDEWSRLTSQAEQNRLSHALLFTGAEQAGKSTLAHDFAAWLLCQGEIRPCGLCHQCELVAAGTHPDLLEVTLEDSKQIKVEQIRDIIDWANQTAQQGGQKVCLIDPADTLNLQASNALLKILEEPPENTQIFLVTAQPSRLLPTLRSRCQIVECRQPGKEEALDWVRSKSDSSVSPELLLKIAGGVPLRTGLINDDFLSLRTKIATHLMPVIEGQGSPLQLASSLAKDDPVVTLDILYRLMADSIALRASSEEYLQNTDLEEIIRRIDQQMSPKRRHALLDRICEAKAGLQGTSNPNTQMLLEWVFAASA